METITLSNGIRLVVETRPSQMFYINVLVKCGSVYEKKHNSGIAHFIEHMLFKGTKNRTATQIMTELDNIGTNIDAATTYDYTYYKSSCLLDDAESLVNILADMVTNPLFSPSDIASESKVILEEYYMADDSLEEYISDKTYRAIYKNSPKENSVIGRASVIANMTSAKLHNFHHRYYCGENISISVVSSLDAASVYQLIKLAFNNISRGEAAICPISKFLGGYRAIRKGGNDLPVAMLSFDAHPQTMFALEDALMCDILNRRLFVSIREELALSYAVGASLEQDDKDGILTFEVSASNENINQCIEIFIDEINTLKTCGCTETELAKAQKNSIRNLIKTFEANDSRSSFNAMMLFMYQQVYDFERFKAEFMRINCEDIKKSAQRIFTKNLLYVFCGAMKNNISYEEVTNRLI